MRECCSGCRELRALVAELAEIVRDCVQLHDCDVEVEIDMMIKELRRA